MPERKYEFRMGFHHTGLKDPNVVGQEIERIRGERDGVTPRELWQKSKAKSAVLYTGFEWDNRKAGDLYRDEQARHILRSVCIVEVDVDSPGPAFVRVVVADAPMYVPTRAAMSDVDMREQVLEDARRELAGARRRLEDLARYDAPKARRAVKHVRAAEEALT